ncbi:hypothetical protein ACHAXR_002589 [Thalassiosira sp. AJA248-18]
MTKLHSMNDVELEWTGPTGPPGSLERLCSISLRACQLMNPLISRIYQQIVDESTSSETNTSVKKAKKDNSQFTISDGLVQRLLINVLFSNVSFRDIVGEEDEGEEDHHHDDGNNKNEGDSSSDEWWFHVQGLTIPNELRPLVESTRDEIESLASNYLSTETSNGDGDDENCCSDYEHITVFIDPIDGTREFSTGKGEQCSVCIGFATNGKSVGGVVYRPLSLPKPSWVAGAKSEGYAASDFGDEGTPSTIIDTVGNNRMMRGGLLTTNGSISPFVESLIDELQFDRVKSGGAGNKMMLLLESSYWEIDGGMLYIQDRGVSRWDTCAAEACLEAYGGRLMKMTHILDTDEDDEHSKEREFYTYLASQTNLDFIPGSANLTKYNCRTFNNNELELNQKVNDVDQVKPYSNLCGLVAIGSEWNTVEGIKYIKDAIQRAAESNPPSFD